MSPRCATRATTISARSSGASALPQASCSLPHVYASSLIDGKGPYTAQVANVATSEAEAIALVDKAKANGFTGVKFYGTFNPAWLPASIREAHKLGLHVHGHIPAGMRPVDAIAAGYDEITHINWVMMQAMPDSVIPVSNGIMRFEGPGRYAKDVTLGIRASKRSSARWSANASITIPRWSRSRACMCPRMATCRPPTRRSSARCRRPPSAASGPAASPCPRTSPARTTVRAGRGWLACSAKCTRRACPSSLAPTGSASRSCASSRSTWKRGSARRRRSRRRRSSRRGWCGQDAKTGSVKVGKTADLVLVDGDPSTRIGDLRQTRVVMLDGKLLDADALRTAAGFSGRPEIGTFTSP